MQGTREKSYEVKSSMSISTDDVSNFYSVRMISEQKSCLHFMTYSAMEYRQECILGTRHVGNRQVKLWPTENVDDTLHCKRSMTYQMATFNHSYDSGFAVINATFSRYLDYFTIGKSNWRIITNSLSNHLLPIYTLDIMLTHRILNSM